MLSNDPQNKPKPNPAEDRIESNTIYLKAEGQFPKRVVIIEAGRTREYILRKTRSGGFLLN